MIKYDPAAIAKTLAPFDFHEFAPFNAASFAVFHGDDVAASDWEIHRDTDEFLFVLEGSVTVEILSGDSPDGERERFPLFAGQFVVVPCGHWHRHVDLVNLTEMYLTPGSSEQSEADDPRAD